MYRSPLICLASALIACSNGQSPDSAHSDSTDSVIKICDLPHRGSSSDVRKARVRGRMLVGEHEIFLTDEERCPAVTLFLEYTTNGPDIILCSNPELVAKFGCPGGNGNGPVVTTEGILRMDPAGEIGWMKVEKMTEFQTLKEARRDGW